jgi:hypothetical protein
MGLGSTSRQLCDAFAAFCATYTRFKAEVRPQRLASGGTFYTFRVAGRAARALHRELYRESGAAALPRKASPIDSDPINIE